MDEQKNSKLNLQKDAEILAKLVGKTVVHLSREWDVERRVFRDFYSINGISSVELETNPHKAIILKFTDGNHIMFLNLNQFDDYLCKVGEYGSIREYLEANGFSAFE